MPEAQTTLLPIGKRIDTIIKLALATPLKAAGFKKQARVFRRSRDDGAVEVIDIQGGKYNTEGKGEFTVNLGLYLPQIAAMLDAPPLEKPQEHQCHFRQRIGALLPEKDEDFWWSMDTVTHDEALAHALQQAVLNHALPWFACFTPEAFQAAGGDFGQLPGGAPMPLDPLHAASFYLLLGEHDKARERLNIGLEYRKSLAAQIHALAAAHGLVLNQEPDA